MDRARGSLSFRLVELVEAWLRRHASPAQLRRAYRAGYLVLRPWWFIARPRTRGVKVVVRCGEAVLLVRHSYARRREWDLPGGYVRPDEEPETALLRELAEELAVTPVSVVAIAATSSRAGGKRETLFTFVADVADRSFTPDPVEIAHAAWFAVDALPPRAARLTRRMVARAGWECWTPVADIAGERALRSTADPTPTVE